MSKPSIPKGTRDFGPKEMVKRNYIFDAIRSVFQKYGYLPIETPAMEKTETLLGKYGEEGDRLIFKILKRGASLEKDEYKIRIGEKATYAEEALRYDLTVPFARYVAQNQNEFPFRLSATKFNLFGEPIDRRKVVTENFINAMWM